MKKQFLLRKVTPRQLVILTKKNRESEQISCFGVEKK